VKLRDQHKAGEPGREARWAVIQFALAGLASVLIVGVVAALLFSRAGRDEAVNDARQLTRSLALGVVEPNLRPGVLRGDPQEYRRFDQLMRDAVVVDPVVRVKLWTPDGRVLYSDEPRLVGSRYPLGEDELERLHRGGVESELAELSDLSGPENRFERVHGELLEVYIPVEAEDGEPALFELYMRYSSVADSGRRIWLTFAPALVVALLALWLLQIPLAGSLVRRLRARERERERLLLHAMEASNAERRRIAGDLHDGVVQDMTGTALALSAAASRGDPPSPDELRRALHDGAIRTRQSLRRLRSLLVNIYPPNLHSEGLEAALGDLVTALPAKGVETHVDVHDAQPMPRHVEQLVFRTAQEALRNVAEHAGASEVSLKLETPDGLAVLTVEDDGRGFDPGAAQGPRAGHFGMSLLADRATDLGGTLSVESRPGEGTKLKLEVPT
jgi:signal transduction histidine kinase